MSLDDPFASSPQTSRFENAQTAPLRRSRWRVRGAALEQMVQPFSEVHVQQNIPSTERQMVKIIQEHILTSMLCSFHVLIKQQVSDLFLFPSNNWDDFAN